MIKFDKRIMVFITALFLITMLVGCSRENSSQNTFSIGQKGVRIAKGEGITKAIYLAPESGGQLAEEDIEKYLEVIRVTSFTELKESVSKNTSIWIDKDTADLLDSNWLQEEAQSRIPIVLIGYNNALYSFREKLSGFDIEGPHVDWSEQKLEPGFSVWMLKEKNNQSQSAFMKGYSVTPDTKQILSITNTLLEGKFPE